MLSDKKKLRF